MSVLPVLLSVRGITYLGPDPRHPRPPHPAGSACRVRSTGPGRPVLRIG